MTRFLAILAALTCAASAQTYRTVTADTNNVIRTNFTLGAAQISGSFAISNVTGLQTALDGKLATNGDAAGLTNFPPALLQTNGDASGLTNFPALVLTTNSTESAFPSDLLRTNGDASGLSNLPAPSLSNVSGVLAVTNGGTGADSADGALTNLTLYRSNSTIQLGQSADSKGISNGVVIGAGASVDFNSDHGSIVVGQAAESRGVDAIAIGRSALTTPNNSIQIGTGTNASATNTIQIFSWGSVNSTEWGYLANASTRGGYAMTNTAAISGSKTFVAYDGTNYTTNTVTFSNGIITGWTP